MTKDTTEFAQFSAVACREYTLPIDEEASQPKGWIQGNTIIGLVFEIATCCFHGKYGVEIRISSVNRDNTHSWVRILMDQTSLWWIWTTMSRKFQKFSSENMRWNWMGRILHADQRPMQNHKEENLLTLPQELYFIGERIWTDVEPGEYALSDYAVSKKLINGELKRIFRNISRTVLIGLTTGGRKAWQEEEETRKDTSIVLILHEQFCISELFKDIQVAALLILFYRTMLLFRATSSSTFIMSDVQSIYIPSSTRDWNLEVKI